jgi:hypothetical protein
LLRITPEITVIFTPRSVDFFDESLCETDGENIPLSGRVVAAIFESSRYWKQPFFEQLGVEEEEEAAE